VVTSIRVDKFGSLKSLYADSMKSCDMPECKWRNGRVLRRPGGHLLLRYVATPEHDNLWSMNTTPRTKSAIGG
jgi:hypothetical protein